MILLKSRCGGSRESKHLSCPGLLTAWEILWPWGAACIHTVPGQILPSPNPSPWSCSQDWGQHTCWRACSEGEVMLTKWKISLKLRVSCLLWICARSVRWVLSDSWVVTRSLFKAGFYGCMMSAHFYCWATRTVLLSLLCILKIVLLCHYLQELLSDNNDISQWLWSIWGLLFPLCHLAPLLG